MHIDGRVHYNNPNDVNNQKIREICSQSFTIADLIVKWLQDNQRSLTIINPNYPKTNCLMVSFEAKKDSVAMLFCDLAQEVKQYPGFQPLNRNVSRFADQEGYLPDYEWMEQRDKRLKSRWNDENGFLEVSPRGFGEVILSYVVKSPGMAKISRRIAAYKHVPHDIYHADLAFFEKEKSYGFHEVFAVKCSQFERFVDGRYAKNSAAMISYAKRQLR